MMANSAVTSSCSFWTVTCFGRLANTLRELRGGAGGVALAAGQLARPPSAVAGRPPAGNPNPRRSHRRRSRRRRSRRHRNRRPEATATEAALLLGSALERARVRRAEADRVDPDPSGDRVRGRLQRRDAPVVGPVGQQDDDVGDVALDPGLVAGAGRAAGEPPELSVPPSCGGSGRRRPAPSWRPAGPGDRPRRWRRATARWPRRWRCPGRCVRLSSAWSRAPRSVVGATASSANPLNSTRPIWVPPGSELTNLQRRLLGHGQTVGRAGRWSTSSPTRRGRG